MKIFNYSIISILLFTGYFNASAKKPVPVTKSVTVEKVINDTTTAVNAILYNLPKTAFDVIIETEKTIQKRGPFYRYSERYLGLRNVILEDEVSYKLKSVQLKPRGIADADKCYKISYKGDVSAPYVTLDKDGKLLAINTTADQPQCISVPESESIAIEDTSFAYTPFTEDQLIVSSTAKMAEESATAIYDLRRSRTEIISGTAPLLPTDGKAYELSLKEISRLEKSFLELFMGKTAKQTIYNTFTFIPGKEMNNEILFRFSKFAGLVDKMDISGEPVYISLQKQAHSKLAAEEELNEESLMISGTTVTKSLVYNIPVSANMLLKYKTKTILTQTVSVAQFGSVATLPTGIMERPTTSVIFYPETGAIKSIIK